MAAAYGAAAGVAFWVMFRAGMWVFDTGVGVWCRRQDKRREARERTET
jgi:hypothetical protein